MWTWRVGEGPPWASPTPPPPRSFSAALLCSSLTGAGSQVVAHSARVYYTRVLSHEPARHWGTVKRRGSPSGSACQPSLPATLPSPRVLPPRSPGATTLTLTVPPACQAWAYFGTLVFAVPLPWALQHRPLLLMQLKGTSFPP